MQTISMQEIQELYNICGLGAGSVDYTRNSINLGKMNNKLNANLSGIYGNSSSNNLSNVTTVFRRPAAKATI